MCTNRICLYSTSTGSCIWRWCELQTQQKSKLSFQLLLCMYCLSLLMYIKVYHKLYRRVCYQVVAPLQWCVYVYRVLACSVIYSVHHIVHATRSLALFICSYSILHSSSWSVRILASGKVLIVIQCANKVQILLAVETLKCF